MDKTEFEELTKIFKDGWNQLAISGNEEKPYILRGYVFNCPACSVAFSLINSVTKQHRCYFCPVKLWQFKFRDNGCVSGDDVLFLTWKKAKSIEERKKLAKLISQLEWNWIPEYQFIDVKRLRQPVEEDD